MQTWNDPSLAPERAHDLLAESAQRSLAYNERDRLIVDWQNKARKKLRSLLMPRGWPEEVNLDFTIKTGPDVTVRRMDPDKFGSPVVGSADPGTRIFDTYDITFMAERNVKAIGRLFRPRIDPRTGIPPLLICLEGHHVDMRTAWGEVDDPPPVQSWREDGLDYGRQALERGYAVFVLEQRGFGVRSDQRSPDLARYGGRCHNPAMVALLYGRTLIGERVHDVSRCITVLNQIVQEHTWWIDLSRIGCVGHSGGGTTTIFATALDKRIKAAIVAGSFGQIGPTTGTQDHCVCAHIPDILNHLEMGDIGALVAPRPLVVSHGVKDPRFPIETVHDALLTTRKAYESYAKAIPEENLALVEHDAGHIFGDHRTWDAFRRVTCW